MSRVPTALFAVSAIVALAACIIVAAATPLHAYWIADGVPVCTTAESQQFPQAASDGAGGAIIVWHDVFSGSWDICAQRVSASGKVMWASEGVPVCFTTGNQMYPVIVSDGAGGAIVAWYDGRSGNDDIYAQHVNASGTCLWAANGVALCTAAGNQQAPRICPDGAGGAIVTWRDNRAGNIDVYAQRVNAFGAVQWTVDGVALSAAAGSQSAPEIAPDGAGGAVVAWEDNRSGNYDIYVQHVTYGGLANWTANGVALCTTTDYQLDPVIASDGTGGAIVAWVDERGTYNYIHAQRANASGTVQWAANGIAVCASSHYQSKPFIASDEKGGAVVAWMESRGTFGVYAQRLNASGVGQWSTSGVLLCDGMSSAMGLYGAPDGAGGAIVAWHDGSPDDIFAQRVSYSGTLPWGSAKRKVCAAIDDQTYPSVAADGAGGAIVTWNDYRNGSTDIYAQLVDPAGRVGWLAPEIESVVDVPGDQGGHVFLSWYAARADRYMEDVMSHYTIWRSIDVTQAALAIERGTAEIGSLAELEPAPGGFAASSGRGAAVILVEETGALATFWELVDTQDALYMEGYAKTEETLYDSTAYFGGAEYFRVVAHTSDPRVYWISASEKGWSIDNLPPGAPLGLEGERIVVPAGLALTWDPNVESDFSCYALYRGLSKDFVPGAGNFLGQIDETEYFDGEWNWGAGYYYKLSAIDVNGNESPFALFSPDNLTGDETPRAPAASYLAQNFPNPFNPTTRIVFGLAAPADVSLRIYDAAGRLVRALVEGARPAGNYTELWDGRDSGGRAVASGIYFYRLTAGAFTETRKMALLR